MTSLAHIAFISLSVTFYIVLLQVKMMMIAMVELGDAGEFETKSAGVSGQ